MPNVDSCVREAEQALCSDTEIHAMNIASMSNDLRVRLFKNKNSYQISKILSDCSRTIKLYILNHFYKISNLSINNIVLQHENTNNKIGADLFHILPNKEKICIEVKFGMQTDKNIGMTVFDKIFGCNIFSKVLSLSIRKQWQSMYFCTQDEKAQINRLWNTLNNAIDIFNKFQENKNYTLTQEEQNYMENIILNTSGSENLSNIHYIKFVLDNENFSNFARITTGIGFWNVQKVERLSDNISRVNVFVNNYDTNIQIKYTLNWKNNYHKGNNIASAKLGLGSSCWNVWVHVEISKIII